jgi:hypothetical protein
MSPQFSGTRTALTQLKFHIFCNSEIIFFRSSICAIFSVIRGTNRNIFAFRRVGAFILSVHSAQTFICETGMFGRVRMMSRSLFHFGLRRPRYSLPPWTTRTALPFPTARSTLPVAWFTASPKSAGANLPKSTEANLPKSTEANLPKSTETNLPNSAEANLPNSAEANLPKSAEADGRKQQEKKKKRIWNVSDDVMWKRFAVGCGIALGVLWCTDRGYVALCHVRYDHTFVLFWQDLWHGGRIWDDLEDCRLDRSDESQITRCASLCAYLDRYPHLVDAFSGPRWMDVPRHPLGFYNNQLCGSSSQHYLWPGINPLHRAVELGNLLAIRALIERGARMTDIVPEFKGKKCEWNYNLIRTAIGNRRVVLSQSYPDVVAVEPSSDGVEPKILTMGDDVLRELLMAGAPVPLGFITAVTWSPVYRKAWWDSLIRVGVDTKRADFVALCQRQHAAHH